MVQAKQAKKVKATSKAPIAHGVGRRKSAVARAWLRKGSGKVTVNERDIAQYFDVEKAHQEAMEPFKVVPSASRFDLQVNVKGGGFTAQAGAVRLAISRAILDADKDTHAELRKHGLLTVDSRVKERKKPGQKAARRKFQFVKR